MDYDNGNYVEENVRANFEFIDSAFVARRNTSSKMSQIISLIPQQRQSALTETIKKLDAGAGNKNGAVLILW